MATQAELEKLVGHAAFDADFRKWLFTDPVTAAKSIGIGLAPKQADYIQGLGPGAADKLTDCLSPFVPPIDPSWG